MSDTSLKQRINDDVKTAMRNKDKERLGTLRLITAAIKQKEVDERIELNDDQVLNVLEKMIKQHKDSIEQYDNAGRSELADKEKAELVIIQEYMPAQLSEAEVTTLIDEAISETGASEMKEMGKVMGLLKPKLAGRADMGQVSALIKAKLSN
ncbi:MAG: GatB/YqeY domain-containing protein [Pseudomonadota bacterium]|nr:GatB/YqeY domain-containing protein [Pseudomonadota bacterium]